MKTITREYKVYEYNELSEEAKEQVKEDYLNDDFRNELLQEDLRYELYYRFPKSNLEVQYDLSYCQGSGLNIYGKLNLYDFLELWEATDKEKRTIEFYLDNSNSDYNFTYNREYGYSCKFIDKKHMADTIDEFIEYLEYQDLKNINTKIIEKFFYDMIEYFDKLDAKFENNGYDYLYEITDEEMEEESEANEWLYTEDGKLFS